MSQSLLQKQMKNSEWGLPGLRRTQTWPSLDNVLSCCLSVWTPLACKHAMSACCRDTLPWTMVYSPELRHHVKVLWQIVHGYHVGGECSNVLISECWRVNLFICGAQLYLRKEPWLYTSLAASHSAKPWSTEGYLLTSKIAFFLPQQGERSQDRFSTVLLQKD